MLQITEALCNNIGQFHITPDAVESLRNEADTRQKMLQQIIGIYEARYRCSLTEFEKKIANVETDEHPAWEDSIEWRNAVEQLERIRLSENIFVWLKRLLKQLNESQINFRNKQSSCFF